MDLQQKALEKQLKAAPKLQVKQIRQLNKNIE
jgi:uncharacterized protein YneF (UPF0154 family)